MSLRQTDAVAGAVESAGCPYLFEYTLPSDDVCGRPGFDPAGWCVFHSPLVAEKAAAFSDALQQQSSATFEGYVFPPTVDFAANDFARANFAHAVFTGDVTFADTIFGGPVIFDGAVFEGKADFSNVEFGRFTSFWRARWRGPVRFFRATFQAEALFIGASFDSAAGFTDTLFARGAQFQNVRFDGRSLFLRCAFLGPVNFAFADLSRVGFRAMAAATRHERIARLSLAPCEFRLARGLEEARFDEVDWGDRTLVRLGPFRLRQTYTVFDDILARVQGNPVLLAETELVYRALRHNAEASGDRRAASAFHYNEREMERLALPKPMRHFWSLPALNWLFAGYGERPERPLGWLLVLLFVFGVVFTVIAEMQRLPDPFALGLTQSFATMTFQGGPLETGPGGLWWQGIQRALTLVLVALCAWALLRRLRR